MFYNVIPSKNKSNQISNPYIITLFKFPRALYVPESLVFLHITPFFLSVPFTSKSVLLVNRPVMVFLVSRVVIVRPFKVVGVEVQPVVVPVKYNWMLELFLFPFT